MLRTIDGNCVATAVQEIEAAPIELEFSPRQARTLRSRILQLVMMAIPQAETVLQGSRKWSPQQVRLFTSLMAKVLPDLSAAYIQHDIVDKPLEELSREDLERIVAGSAA